MQIDWPNIPDATEDNKRAADMLILAEDGQERRTGYDGGWINFADATHTASNKQSVTADTLTHFTVDGLGAETVTDFRRGIPLDVFGNSTIQPAANGEAYNVNVTFLASKSSSQNAYIEIDVGIGSDYSTIVARDRRALTKGSGVQDAIFFNGTLFVTPAFARYGARFFMFCSENVSVWNKSVMLQRTHSP